jgi:hypothetical protein
MTTVKHVLKRARQLIARHGGWYKGNFARDKNYRGLKTATAASAVSFCLAGAIQRASHDLNSGSAVSSRAHQAVYDALQKRHKRWRNEALLKAIGSYNDSDSRCKRDILRVLDKAILKTK